MLHNNALLHNNSFLLPAPKLSFVMLAENNKSPHIYDTILRNAGIRGSEWEDSFIWLRGK